MIEIIECRLLSEMFEIVTVIFRWRDLYIQQLDNPSKILVEYTANEKWKNSKTILPRNIASWYNKYITEVRLRVHVPLAQPRFQSPLPPLSILSLQCPSKTSRTGPWERGCLWMSKMEQARVGSGFAILKNGFEQKVEIWRSYLVIQEKSRRFRYCFTQNSRHDNSTTRHQR